MNTLKHLCVIMLSIALLSACSDMDASRKPPVEAVPKGTVIAYYAKTGPVPKGWVICDGTNGTPDLRHKFIRGEGNMSDVGSTGGAEQIVIDAGGRKGSDWHWGETPWAGGPNPVIGGMTKSILPPYVGILYLMYIGTPH